MESWRKELYHHGIKGQKWGKKNGPPYPLDYGEYKYRKGDTVLDKNSSFQRITTNSNSGYTKGVYVSYKKSDKDLYKGVLGRMRISYLNKQGEDAKLNEITLKSKDTVRMPSREKRLSEFKKLYDDDPKGVMALINEHETSRYGRKPMDGFDSSDKNQLESMYQKFNDAFGMGKDSKNNRIITRYYFNLKKQGYNAIPDENDIRLSTFKANAPIILFNTKETIGSSSQRELNASEVFSAYKRSIGKKTVRDLLLPKGIGSEKLSTDTSKTAQKYADQLRKDKNVLSDKYTMNDLATDWGKNRLSTSQIERVSKNMDKGMSHDEAVARVTGLGNVIVDKILNGKGV